MSYGYGPPEPPRNRRGWLIAAIAAGALVVGASVAFGTVEYVRAHSSGAISSAAVSCGRLYCSHGRLGQACIASGYPGIVVQASNTQLACDPRPASFSPAPVVTPAVPSPVSTAANLSSNCVVGWASPILQDGYANGGTYGNFTLGHGPRHINIQGSSFETALGYQLTLTNISANTAEVTGFAVVFYDRYGTELGSDQQATVSNFITPGQSLTWTEIANGTQISHYGTAGNANVPVGAATCDLVQWYHP